MFPSNAITERYFIATSLDQCDGHENACMSLSSFAANASNYLQLSSNGVELNFYAGNHSLHSKLAIGHIKQLWFHSNISHSSDTTVVCIDHAARFEFTNIAQSTSLA